MSFQLDRDMADVEKQIFDTQRALENDQLQLEAASAEVEMFEAELDLLLAEQEEASIQLMSAEEPQQTWQESWDAITARASEPPRQAEVSQTKIQSAEQRILRLEQQQQR